MFGNPETTTGGLALKFYASVRMDVRRIQSIKSGADVVGSRTRVRITKNKVAPPFREAEFDIMYNEGISKEGDIVDLGAELEVISKRGAFFSYGEQRIGQGRENAKAFLREHPDISAAIEAVIRAQAGVLKAPVATRAADGDDEAAEAEE
jgi:recombination protein RecA